MERGRNGRAFLFMSDTSLEHFIEDLSGSMQLRVQDNLGFGYVRLKAAEAQRRQAKQDIRCFEDVVIEMLRNSRDADSHLIFLASWTEGDQRFLTLLDDGKGIPESMHETIFEPFVTSKLDSFHSDRWGVHGRGMALYSIRQNVETAQVLASEPGFGSVFAVVNDTHQLTEKRDQSTPPSIVKGAEGNKVLRGPHNIIRTTLEFAIDERNSLAVYLGSASEIASTLFWMGRGAIDRVDPSNCLPEQLPYIQRFGRCKDAASLASLAESLGLPLSTRTAYRIIAGEVKPLNTLLEAVLGNGPDKQVPAKGKKRATKRPAVRISAEDLESLKNSVADSYASLAEAYYLEKDPGISIGVKGSDLIIKIPLEPH